MNDTYTRKLIEWGSSIGWPTKLPPKAFRKFRKFHRLHTAVSTRAAERFRRYYYALQKCLYPQHVAFSYDRLKQLAEGELSGYDLRDGVSSTSRHVKTWPPSLAAPRASVLIEE